MLALIHAHTNGALAGVWVEGAPPESAYVAGHLDFAERGASLLGQYDNQPWERRVQIMARRSPYLEQWAISEVPDALNAAQALRVLRDREVDTRRTGA